MKRFLARFGSVLFLLLFLISHLLSCNEPPATATGEHQTTESVESGSGKTESLPAYTPKRTEPEEGTYYIVSKTSGKALMYSDGTFEDKNRLVLFSINKTRSQKMKLERNENGDYLIKSPYMNQYLSMKTTEDEAGYFYAGYSGSEEYAAFAIEARDDSAVRFLLASDGYNYAICVTDGEKDGSTVSVKRADGGEDEYFYLRSEKEVSVETFTNPVSSGHAADPFVKYYEGYYYCLTTWGDRIRLYRGKEIENVLKSESKDVYLAGNEVGGLIWAPELHKIGDRWYIYSSGSTSETTFSTIRMFCLQSAGDDPFGEYTFKGFTDKSILAIDETVYYDEDSEKLYTAFSRFTSSGQVITLAEMTNPWTISDNRVDVSTPVYTWETSGAVTGKDSRVNEGPIFLKNDGKLFLIYSGSGCWSQYYCLGMLEYKGGDFVKTTSWKKSSKPVFSAANNVYGVGHCSFFKSPDGTETWIAYHGMATPDAGEAGRFMYAQRISFSDEGSPIFNEPLPRGLAIPVPSGE